jgi:hypothetical protein
MLLTGLTALVLITGCSDQNAPTEDPQVETPPVEAPVAEEPAPEEEPPVPSDDIAGPWADLKEGAPSATAIGQFLTSQHGSLSPAAVDDAIETLLLEQRQLIDRLNNRIYRTEYLFALNDTMGGVMNAEAIDGIEPESVRADFRSAHDALLTIVRYEETPVFEPDWSRLQRVAASAGEDLELLTRLFSKVQNRGYGYPVEHESLVLDTITTENALLRVPEGVVHHHLRNLYDRQIATLLVGPEGETIGLMMDPDSEERARLSFIRENYPTSALADLAAELDEKLESGDFMSSTNVILRHRPFGLDHPGTLKSVDVTLDSVQSRRMLLDRWPEEEIGEKVNETIHGVMDAQIIDRDTEQSVNAYVQFANGDFLSLAISSSYQDENGAFQFEETHLTFDLNTGETVTLGEVLRIPEDEAALLVEEVLLNRAVEGPYKGFYLSDQGIWLITETGQELLSHGQIATAGHPIDHLLRD